MFRFLQSDSASTLRWIYADNTMLVVCLIGYGSIFCSLLLFGAVWRCLRPIFWAEGGSGGPAMVARVAHV